MPQGILAPIPILLAGLGLATLLLVIVWIAYVRRHGAHGRPTAVATGVGLVTLFFDTLGIGNYAPTTAIFKLTGMVADELIPGTLNVGSAVPVALEAFAYVAVIPVDVATLALLVPAGAAGGWFGARVVSRLPRRPIQIGMGVALFVGAAFMFMTNLQWIPGGGDAIGFTGAALAAAAVVNFSLGALMALGIGCYAPSLLVFSLMGLNPRSAFPIMMGSASYMIAVIGIRFVKAGRFNSGVALALTLGGIPGVLVAAYIVKSLPLEAIRWLVVAVVLYASYSMLSAARERSREARPSPAAEI